MRRTTIAAAVLAVSAATALASPAAADEQTDQQFLAAIAEYGVQVGDDATAIDMAQEMCEKLGSDRKKGVEAALGYVKENSDLSDDGITKFAGIAAQVYCPEDLPG